MLIEKSETVNLFELVPLERDEMLEELDQLLEEDALFQEIKSDLTQRCPHTLTRGRYSTPVEVILRMLVVKHLYSRSYEKAELLGSPSPVRAVGTLPALGGANHRTDRSTGT